ncbi:MAG: dethiobiotin synthase [Lentisphaeria bacterium]
MGQVYFISGIDTDVGKTIATGMLARYLLQQKKRVITVKMVQTGNVGFSEDLDLHRKIMGGISFPEDKEGWTAPQIFSFPASPHFAAKLDHREVEPDKIIHAVKLLSERYDIVLVEGAGGLMVPLTEDYLTIDFAAAQKWPMFLVTSGKLGSLNHTILSIEAATNRKMKIVGTIYNYCPTADPQIDADTERMTVRCLQKYGQSPALVRIPKVSLEKLSDIDFSVFF